MKVGIGQDSHKFDTKKSQKKCKIAGVIFDNVMAFDADSDGDVAYHAICNAITSITNVHILGDIAIKMCRNEKITDSREYLKKATETLGENKIVHVALSIEAYRPRLQTSIDQMRTNIAKELSIEVGQVGITCTSGDGLTEFGKGLGCQCFCILTVA